MKRVVYITYPWYLDFSVEYIKELSTVCKLSVIVVCPENRESSTIFSIDKFKKEKSYYNFSELEKNIRDYDFFKDYFEKCESVGVFFSPSNWRSLKSVRSNFQFYNLINGFQPDEIHLDDLSIDVIWAGILLRNRKLNVNVHDPEAHSGEDNLRKKIIRKLMFLKKNDYYVFSNNSFRKFRLNYPNLPKVHELSLIPYYFYNKYNLNDNTLGEYILFIGRVSKYKGVEDLIVAFNKISDDFPNLKLVIAGRANFNYRIPSDLLQNPKIEYIDRFIENNEIKTLVGNSKFVVCPYKDATQSGVVMTCFALGKEVLVSSVGGLFEPVNENNGYVYNAEDKDALQEGLRHMLKLQVRNKKFLLDDRYSAKKNVSKLKDIYEIL